MRREVVIKNKSGLHARPVTKFVHACKAYDANVYISKNDQKVAGDSILKVMSLGLAYGDTAVISAEGLEAEKAVNNLADFLEDFIED